MKKNGLLKIAAVVFAITILTTCLISGTFAKFTSEASGTGTANVAKWSFTVDSTDIATTNTFTITLGSDKLAPGVKLNATQIAITNASDVVATVTATVSEIKIMKGGVAQTVTEIVDLAKYLAKFELKDTLAATELAAAAGTTLDISLEWLNVTTGTADEIKASDAIDTAMGKLFATDTYTLEFTVTITATQKI